jgi:hypothetical protein
VRNALNRGDHQILGRESAIWFGMPSLSVVVLPDFFVQELQGNLVKRF